MNGRKKFQTILSNACTADSTEAPAAEMYSLVALETLTIQPAAIVR